MEVSFRGYENLTVRAVKIGKGAEQKTGYAISGKFNNKGFNHLEKMTEKGFFDLFSMSKKQKNHFIIHVLDNDIVSINKKPITDKNAGVKSNFLGYFLYWLENNETKKNSQILNIIPTKGFFRLLKDPPNNYVISKPKDGDYIVPKSFKKDKFDIYAELLKGKVPKGEHVSVSSYINEERIGL